MSCQNVSLKIKYSDFKISSEVRDKNYRFLGFFFNLGHIKNFFFLDSGKLRDTDSLNQVNYARECFRILRDENLFTPEDLIYIQYLLKTTDCEELYTRCYEYARKQSSLCFYEMPTGNINEDLVIAQYLSVKHV